MQKFCPCGKKINFRLDLCKECLDLYGTDKKEWPEWLVYMVSDIKRETDYENKHQDDLEFDEDRDSNDPEIEFE